MARVLFILALTYLIAGTGQVCAEEFPTPDTVRVAAGPFLAGSTPDEREFGYRLDETAYGHSVTRKNGWYDRERSSGQYELPDFSIARNLITNDQYHEFVIETGHAAPSISLSDWRKQGLIHPYSRVERFLWKDGRIPIGRGQHPVVLVSWHDANAFAEWLSRRTGQSWRLPKELEWEKAARGKGGQIFPWGSDWRSDLLNSHDKGPFDTMAVGSFPEGASPYGMLDAAGQVFEWTASPAGSGNMLVKGGSWDDKGCGVCRAAARHGRPKTLKHILVGFRLVLDGE